MGMLPLLSEHWFDVIETVGVVGGLLLTAYTIRKDERARQIANLIAINDRYDFIWSKLYERPQLARILDKDADLRKQPISDEEQTFVKMLFLHLDTVRRASQAGLFIKMEGLQRDIRDFFTLPIPRAVWERIEPFQDRNFIALIESSLR